MEAADLCEQLLHKSILADPAFQVLPVPESPVTLCQLHCFDLRCLQFIGGLPITVIIVG